MNFASAPLALLSVALFSLAGCATPDSDKHKLHHPDSASGPQATMSSGEGGMSMMDMKSMCEMHEKMMHAKNADERRAMMSEGMKTMSPEMMKKHMDMMDQQCK